MTMLVMAIYIISIEEKFIERTHAITKLTKTIKEKDLQIASLISKIEA